MSTLKTNNIEHVDASTPSVQMSIGGGVVFPGISTFTGNATFSGNVSVGGTLTYEDVTSIDSVGIITAQAGIQVTGGSVGIGTAIPGALLSIESTAANAAKIRLGFDSPRYYDIFRGSTTNSGYLNFYGSQSSYVGYTFGGVDGEWMRIKSNGSVGIGTDNPTDNLHVLDSGFAGVIIQSGRSSGNIGGLIFQDNSGNNKANVYGEVDGQLTLSTNGEQRIRIASDGSTYTGGTIITEADMNWGHGTYQRPHIFTGQSGGNPSDAAVVLASPETNPSATRIGSLVFGCKTSSTSGVANSGLKAVINCQTNTNTSDAWKTGAYINFETRLDNGNLAIAQSISSDGQVTKPKQYQFLVETNGTTISSGAWNKLTGLSIDTNHTTGISDGTYWSNSNQRFTAPVTGRYKFYHGGYAAIAASTTNDRYATCFRINGGTLFYICGGNYCNIDSPMNGHTTVYKLSANDYVELWYYSSVGGAWGNGSHGIWWGGYLLG